MSNFFVLDYLEQSTACDVMFVGPMPLRKSIDRLISCPVVYIDGGAVHRENDTDGIVVGDGDSFFGSMDFKLDSVNKDFSDLSFALNQVPARYHNLQLLGFLGGRRDHEFINLIETYNFLSSRKEGTRIDFEGEVIGYSPGSWSINIFGLFSLCVLKPALLSVWGACRYGVEKGIFPEMSSRGLSNIGFGEVFFESDVPVMIFLKADNGLV